MHVHVGLEEQLVAAAPLILQNEAQQTKADEQYVVLLGDYSFKAPGEILEKLKAGMKMMSGMKKMPAAQKLFAQKWQDETQRFVSTLVEGELPDTDIKYDALIANRRTLDEPEIFQVKSWHTVLLQSIAA